MFPDGLLSLIIPPVGLYGGHLLSDNAFGENGFGHNINQTFDWDEGIAF